MVKAFCTPVSGQGGSLWTLTQKSTFPNEFGNEMRATDKVIQKNQNTAKWQPKNQFPSREIKFLTKNGKTTFPKAFFLDICLIIEDCKYNYTAEIKFGKKLFSCVFLGKTNFEQRPENANLCLVVELGAWSMQFLFLPPKEVQVKLDKVRKGCSQ